jgi:hypothetical protein
MSKLKDWYKGQPVWVRRTNTALVVLFALALCINLTKSGPEFTAIAWHLHHGDSITVNGVTFPVYYWYTPMNRRDEFTVSDIPGPLRPAKDIFAGFSIEGHMANGTKTPQERIEEESKITELEPEKLQIKIVSEDLECLETHDPSLPGPKLSCYGDGPIYHVFFVGDENAFTRFKRTLAAAR